MTEICDLDEGDILPCPFCGNSPKVEMTGFHLGGRTIRCDADDCMGPHTTAACVNDAVMQWNKRTGAPAQPALSPGWQTSNWNEAKAAARILLVWKAFSGVPEHVELGKWKASEGVWANTYGNAFSGEPDGWAPLQPFSDGEKAARDYEHGYNDGVEWAQTHGRCSADSRDVHNRPETPKWERRWPHDQPNGWNLDADKFLALVKSADGMMWLALGRAKYLELRVDTRDCGFNLYDRDGKPLNPDEVVEAIEKVKRDYGITAQPQTAQVPDDAGRDLFDGGLVTWIESLPTDAEIRAGTIEECAKFVEQHQENIKETSNGSERYLTPRKVGNQMGIAYVNGLRGLALTRPERASPSALAVSAPVQGPRE